MTTSDVFPHTQTIRSRPVSWSSYLRVSANVRTPFSQVRPFGNGQRFDVGDQPTQVESLVEPGLTPAINRLRDRCSPAAEATSLLSRVLPLPPVEFLAYQVAPGERVQRSRTRGRWFPIPSARVSPIPSALPHRLATNLTAPPAHASELSPDRHEYSTTGDGSLTFRSDQARSRDPLPPSLSGTDDHRIRRTNHPAWFPSTSFTPFGKVSRRFQRRFLLAEGDSGEVFGDFEHDRGRPKIPRLN